MHLQSVYGLWIQNIDKEIPLEKKSNNKKKDLRKITYVSS